ncbi:2-C-methyl-D-erythritol 4-phosphate cytidylyltransferase [Balneicella halophila]|uniref:2-C-methyl-D-erythritol 4-phosphate cytidylyltransferase n=1 Tax=Balneicella halophila TaxID=1537566 RepID=A0A7L4URP9_BALHA|nr:2-C-methyl-D-erythritol 4-phosphate cytidylyltransferase [Balneicella halophila]PVX52430.1 2-C-methyl-D-erythritol 4-phosphate cytidylyltransferase [Balneicella halophila]
MKTIAIVLAGGVGMRMESDKPKQFLEIGDKPIVIHSLEAFQKHSGIDEIILVINEKFRDEFIALSDKYIFSKLQTVVSGGKERSDSSRNALKKLSGYEPCKVLIHDAVRPYVSGDILSDIIRALDKHKAVNLAIPATETVLITNADDEIVSIPPRENVYLAQTPQGFHSDIILKAYELAYLDPDFKATDDCGVVHHYLPSIPIHIVKGSIENKKITYPSDL